MADIIKLDMTDVEDTQLGVFQTLPSQFELTDYENSGVVALASSRVEYVGDFPYRIEGGSVTVSPEAGISDGVVYVIVKEDGGGTATATIIDDALVLEDLWVADKGGFYINSGIYDGAKVIFKMNLASGVYSSKGRLTGKIIGDRLDDDNERAFLYSLIF